MPGVYQPATDESTTQEGMSAPVPSTEGNHHMTDIERTVLHRTVKTHDIEIHVSTLRTPLGEFTDIREYVVSLDQYGRGITFPASLTGDIALGVRDAELSGLGEL